MDSQSALTVMAAVERNNRLSLPKTSSIGLRSGLHDDRNHKRALRASIASRTPATFWLLRLSATTMSPRASVDVRNYSTQARNDGPSMAPSRAQSQRPACHGARRRECRSLPMTVRHCANQPLTARSASVCACHVHAGPGLNEKHQLDVVEFCHPPDPCNVDAVLLKLIRASLNAGVRRKVWYFRWMRGPRRAAPCRPS